MAPKDVDYQVTVVTGESGIDANVMLCISGDEEATANLALRTTKDGSRAKFDRDHTLEFVLKAVNVGKIRKINIGHDGKGSEQQWFLKSIQIETKDQQYTFKANRWLSEEKDDQKTYIDLLPDEQKTPPPSPVPKQDQVIYIITIVTSSEKDAGTDSGVLLTISGDKDATKQFQLTSTKQGDKAVFESGKTNEFEVELDDVGNINTINIGHDSKGLHPNWHLDSVQILKGPDKYNFIAKKVLDQSTPFIDLIPTPASERKTPSPEPVKVKSSRTATPEQKPLPIPETTYKIVIQTGTLQKDLVQTNTNFYVIIHGENDQTKKLYWRDGKVSDKTKLFKKDEKTEVEFKTIDVGKILKIIIGQDQSNNKVVWHIDHVVVKRNNEAITFNAEQTVGHNFEIELYPSPILKKTETIYKILLQTGAYQEEGYDSNIYLTIFGQNGQTKKFPLNKTTKTNKKSAFRKNQTTEFEFKTHDVGKISKILLSQNSDERGILWHIDSLAIKQHNETTTFNVKHKIEKNTEIELLPASISKKSETAHQSVKTSDNISKVVVKTKDVDYTIITSTGDRAIDVPVSMKIRGENGTVSIPLSQTKGGDKPFQSKATNEFICRTTDVGKIMRITMELNETEKDVLWHLKTVEIKKGTETYNFNADVRLDQKENKVNLYPTGALHGHQRDDYVQSELRRLREKLRCESSKLHRPPHKAHEPFVFNDLRPYFDTSSVENAIYSPVNIPTGYYTRITALRTVEPWEAYGMDYGVNYELLKHRKTRSLSSKPTTSRATDDSVDRKQGSTHLPPYPRIDMKKPAEYKRPLTMNDVSKIRSFIRTRYTSEADLQKEKDYKRTHDDLYRMQLDNLDAYHQTNRGNMLKVYHSYLENTPGSKRALRELCDQIAPKNSQSTAKTVV